MKKFISFILLLCIATSFTGIAFAAEQTFTINNVTVSASSGSAVNNCSTYASEILKKIWNNFNGQKIVTTTFNSSYNMLKGKSAAERRITEEHVQEFIQRAPLGSRIRICYSSDETTNKYDNTKYGHTMVLVIKMHNAELPVDNRLDAYNEPLM